MKQNKQTTLIHSGRQAIKTSGPINPPVMRASTIVFDSIKVGVKYAIVVLLNEY
ncbi:hypothetical protein I3679_011455 [Proteus mirabilis]|uniref:Cystathionine beta-lyase n=1 Tax=Proteus mirabilis TaxID=584 RepID=A0ABD5LSV2_PROMI